MSDVCNIRIYDNNFNWLAMTESAESVILTRDIYGKGEFQVKISADAPGAEFLKEWNNIAILNEDPRKSAIIRDFKLEGGRSGDFYTIYGETGAGLLSRRVCVPPTESQVPGALGWDRVNGAAETVLKHYAGRNLANPFNANRAAGNLTIAPDLGRGVAFPAQFRFTPLDEAMRKIAEYSGMGFEFRGDVPSKRWIFDVVPGVNRSVGSSDADPVVFRPEWRNVSGYTYEENRANYRNAGYALGAGADERRQTLIVGDNPAGGGRREITLDCGGVSGMDELQYYGNLKLADYAEVKTLEMEVTNSAFVFGRDYFLGDAVTAVISRLGLEFSTVVQGVTEVWERSGGYRVKARFGDKIPNVFTLLKKSNEVT